MSHLAIYNESGSLISETSDASKISEELNNVGILFKRWPAPHHISASMTPEEIMAAYKTEIDNFIKEGGYQTVDVVSMNADHPEKLALRQKFLSEHTHAEDEIRFFVEGEGLFTLHIKDKVYAVLCCKNDLISVPAGTSHWFDMGEYPSFTAIRFFNNPTGWIAQYTGSNIAKAFPLFE